MLQVIHESMHSPPREPMVPTISESAGSMVDALILETVASVLFDDDRVAGFNPFEQSLLHDKVWHCFLNCSRLFGSHTSSSFNVWKFMQQCAVADLSQLDQERVLLKRCLHANTNNSNNVLLHSRPASPVESSTPTISTTAASSNRLATEMYALLKLFLLEKQLQAQATSSDGDGDKNKINKIDAASVSVQVVHVQLLLYAKHFEFAHQRHLIYEQDIQMIKHTLLWFLKVARQPNE